VHDGGLHGYGSSDVRPNEQPTSETTAALAAINRWEERNRIATIRGSHLDSDDVKPPDGWDIAAKFERQRDVLREEIKDFLSDTQYYIRKDAVEKAEFERDAARNLYERAATDLLDAMTERDAAIKQRDALVTAVEQIDKENSKPSNLFCREIANLARTVLVETKS
jgi:hypothetical protein